MPRSRTQIETDNAARERCSHIIQDATREFKGKRNAQTIAALIQLQQSARIESDPPLLRFLWVEGLKIEIRASLKEYVDQGDGPPQLELFAKDEITIVRKINRARIWLPRAQEHVQYHNLPDTDLNESADYYENHGRGELLLAQNLRELAAMRRPAPARAA